MTITADQQITEITQSTCPPWCQVADHEDADGKPGSEGFEGFHHVLMQSVPAAQSVGGRWFNATLELYPGEAEPRVRLEDEQGDEAVLPIGWAADLARVLIDLAAAHDGTAPENAAGLLEEAQAHRRLLIRALSHVIDECRDPDLVSRSCAARGHGDCEVLHRCGCECHD